MRLPVALLLISAAFPQDKGDDAAADRKIRDLVDRMADVELPPEEAEKAYAELVDLGVRAIAPLERLRTTSAARLQERIDGVIYRIEGWQNPAGFFPTEVGLKLTYRSGEKERTIEIGRDPLSDSLPEGSVRREITGWLPNWHSAQRTVTVTCSGRSLRFDHRDIGTKGGGPRFQPYLTLPFPLAPGREWTFRTFEGCCGWEPRVQVVGREQVTVPAGTYRTLCIRYQLDKSPEHQVIRTWWFARGIGFVKEQVDDTPDNSGTWELTKITPPAK